MLLKTFEMVVATEHLTLIVVAVTFVIFKAALTHGESAHRALQKDDALKYLRRHRIPVKTQIQVLFGLREAGSVKAMQKRFNVLMESDLPLELQQTIRKELWGSKLLSLGLIHMVNDWDDDFVTELAQHCREEVLATNSVIFSEGEASLAAYYILQGTASSISTLQNQAMPDFTEFMWLGENALVNSSFRRGTTARTRSLSSLLVVPADNFREMLQLFALEGNFEQWCCNELWHGLCGRCGMIGDHFSDTCWMVTGERKGRTKPRRAKRLETRMGTVAGLFGASDVAKSRTGFWIRAMSSRSSDSLQTGESHKTVERELEQFLRLQGVEHLEAELEALNILNLADLEELNMDELRSALAERVPAITLSAKEVSALSPPRVLAFRRNMQKEMAKLFQKTQVGSEQHLIFLSHYKLEAGTEAALMRSELEKLIAEQKDHPGSQFSVPVFLDSEDLNNLNDLKDQVTRSHNIVLLLTNGVLSRPWCLVEIVTAVQMDLPVLLADVDKRGNEFVFPDSRWFEELRAGTILDDHDFGVLETCGIDVESIESSIREIFKSIALPYSPHKAEVIRRAELTTLLHQCTLRNPKKMPLRSVTE